MAKASDFDDTVPLPKGLTTGAIKRAIEYIEKEVGDLLELYLEQANVFSAVVGIFGTKALHQYSGFEKNKNPDIAAQRFPDLCRRGRSGKLKPDECLESKGSKRPFAIQSHFNHAGWYIVWRYLVDPLMQIEDKKAVIIWRVDVVFLENDDWKYEGSTAQEGKGGRTHTFGVKEPAKKLKGTAVYKRKDIVVRDGKAVPAESDD